MNFESYNRLLLREKDDDIVLKTGKSFSLDFNIDDEESAFDTLGERELGKFKLSDFED